MEPCPDRTTVQQLSAGALPAADLAAVERHLDGCAACKRLLLQLVTSPASTVDAGQAPPAPEAPDPGQRLGRYRIVDGVGAGGMGTVVAAHDVLLDRKVALKFLTARGAETAPARVLAEAAAMARLSHPNVVKVHDVGVQGGRAYLAMELVDGVNLAEWRARTRPGWRQIAQVVAAAARGLAAAHEVGIVHRDVKPQNILIADARVLVADFGLSARMHAGGDIAGTPRYMAPEQFRGDAVDARTDVFGLCATLYELLHGQPPFAGSTWAELREAAAAGRVQPAPAGSRAPAWLHRLALRGLEPDPERRPPDMAALARALLADPGARRRNRLLAAAGVAVAAGAFWVGGYLKANPERQCRAGSDAIAASWSAARRAQLRDRYQAAGTAASWPPLERRLALYADSWRAVYGASCGDAAREAITPDVLGLRLTCLDGQRAAVEAFVAALSSATPAQLGQAVGATLPSVGDCQFTAASRKKPRPTDPAGAAQATAIEALIVRSGAEQNLGDYARSGETAAAAVAAARKLGYEPLLAEALVRLAIVGKLRGGAAGLQASDKQLSEAYAVAELGQDDRQRLAAAREQASTQLVLGKQEEAEKWGRLGEALLARLGNPPSDSAVLKAYVGWLHYRASRNKEAAVAFREALAWAHKIVPPDPRRLAGAQASLCAAEPSEACARKALAMGLEAYGPDHPEIGAFYANLADEIGGGAAGLAEACALYHKASHVLRTLDPSHPNVIAGLHRESRCLERQGRPREARQLLDRALAVNPPPMFRATILERYGDLAVAHIDVDTGIRHWRSALADYAQTYGPPSEDAIRVRQQIGSALRGVGRVREAVAELDAALEIVRPVEATHAAAGHLHAIRARLRVDQGQYEAAAREARQAMDMVLGSGGTEVNLGYALHALGLAQLRLGRLDEAVATLERGLAARMQASQLNAPEVLADIKAALARALVAKHVQRARACKLGREAAGYYRPLPGQRALYRDIQRWLDRERCASVS
jgi:eukaryotic-like serine/threonine-protein kinase